MAGARQWIRKQWWILALFGIINNQFIAAKIDMEKGEGVQIAMKYHISGYPTFIFLNPDGDAMYIMQKDTRRGERFCSDIK